MNRLLLPAPATKQEPPTEETAPELDRKFEVGEFKYAQQRAQNTHQTRQRHSLSSRCLLK